MRVNHRIDAHQFAGCIYESTSTITGIYGCIGLNKASDLVSSLRSCGASLGTYNTGCNGTGQVKGVTYSQNPLSHFEGIAIAKGNGRKILCIHLDKGDIASRVATYKLGTEGAIIVEGNGDLIGIINNVIIGNDEPIGTDNYAGTIAHNGTRAWAVEATTAPPEEKLERVHIALIYLLLSLYFDVYYRMHRSLCCRHKIGCIAYTTAHIEAHSGIPESPSIDLRRSHSTRRAVLH